MPSLVVGECSQHTAFALTCESPRWLLRFSEFRRAVLQERLPKRRRFCIYDVFLVQRVRLVWSRTARPVDIATAAVNTVIPPLNRRHRTAPGSASLSNGATCFPPADAAITARAPSSTQAPWAPALPSMQYAALLAHSDLPPADAANMAHAPHPPPAG